MKTGKNAGGRRWIINLVLVICLAAELVICIGIVGSKRASFEYRIEYEKDPLILKSVEITNRQDLADIYELYEDERLYEVCLTYENPSMYTGSFRNDLSFREADTRYSVFTAVPGNSGSIVRYCLYEQIVPAQKTGSFTCFIAVPAESESILISEKENKLRGEGKSLTMNLPGQELGTEIWEAAGASGS